MKKNIPFFIAILIFLLISMSCSSDSTSTISTGGPEVIAFKALPFSLDRVKLLDGLFKQATELNENNLLNTYEPDRFLAKFRTEAGLEPKAEHYHGWEDDTIAGHSLGHYLSACSMMYQTTGKIEFLDRVNTIVNELTECQKADGEGYIGAFPDGKQIFEEEIAHGDIRAQAFNLNGLWAPFYTQHKVAKGLLDAYQLCGNEKALQIVRKFADWLETVLVQMSEDQIQEMLGCEHGGINEILVEIYGITGAEKYLNMSRKFYHKAILDPLSRGEDILPGKHGNTQIPKLIGLARRFELTDNDSDRKTAEFFWETVVNHHSYVTGGHGDSEYFGQPDQLRNRLSRDTTETCNVYNMLKLTRHLFAWNASIEAADFYERALFNHILSSQHPENGRVIYNLSLDMGGTKTYQNPFGFTCCVGSGMENHAKYGRNIYFHNDDELFLFQYIASELDWSEKGVTIRQETDFPQEQGTAIHISTDLPIRFTLQIRFPYWAEKGIGIFVNGKKQSVKDGAGRFVGVNRKWRDGDCIEIKLPFSLRLEEMPDDSNRVAVMYGPLVLAGDLGPVGDPRAQESITVPVLMTQERDPSSWLAPVQEKPNTFTVENVGRPRDVELKPFYQTHERRYTVYWDMHTEETLKGLQEEYERDQERRKKIDDRTIDSVQPGDRTSEQNHNFQGEMTGPGRFRERSNRQAERGGWFSYDIKISSSENNLLLVEYWGGFPGTKTFDILVDGEIIATENIANKKDGSFVLEEYSIPLFLTEGKNRITVKFEGHTGHRAGPVFDIRTILPPS
jgi:DUF1680 family protein